MKTVRLSKTGLQVSRLQESLPPEPDLSGAEGVAQNDNPEPSVFKCDCPMKPGSQRVSDSRGPSGGSPT